MSMALAHALEFPDKLRLDKETNMAAQTIYYPGFTVGGIGEALAVIATLIVMLVMRNDGAAFWWVLSAFFVLLLMHVIFWLVIQPTNRYWLKMQAMSNTGAKFFGVNRLDRSESTTQTNPDWQSLRNRWESEATWT
jgi:hypothetical protein